MGWGGDMFPGTVWVYIQTYTNKYTQTNPLERQTHRSKYMYLCIKKDKKSCTEKDKLTHI